MSSALCACAVGEYLGSQSAGVGAASKLRGSGWVGAGCQIRNKAASTPSVRGLAAVTLQQDATPGGILVGGGGRVGGGRLPRSRHGEQSLSSLPRRLAARTGQLSRAWRWREKDGRRKARGSVLRRLILALPEIRPPDRARTPLSIDSAPAIDQPSAKEGFGRSQPARRAKPEASALGRRSRKSDLSRARWPCSV